MKLRCAIQALTVLAEIRTVLETASLYGHCNQWQIYPDYLKIIVLLSERGTTENCIEERLTETLSRTGIKALLLLSPRGPANRTK